MDDSDILADDLRAWFGKGKKGGVGGGGWDRYNTKGERIGKCAAPERGAREGKPKCLSKEKAAQLRAKGGKQAIANAVKRKKAQDPVTDRPGTGNVPKFVSNRIKEQEEQAPVFTFEFEEVLSEKNVPTNPSLWSRAKSEAKKRFDVYPSAYANGWAAKWYKERGGRWRTKKTESNTPHDREWGTDSLVNIYKQDTPGQMDEFFGIHFKEVGSDLVKDFKRDTPGQTNEAKQKRQSVSSASKIDISETLAVIFESLALTAPVELVEPEEHAVPVRAMTETIRHQLLQEAYEDWGELNEAAEYQGRKVQLRKPFRTPGGPKKFSVYVKNDKGNVVKVNFGDPKLSIKRDDPARRRNFRARHGCDNPGPVWKAKYWSCRFWSRKSVTALVKG